MTHKYAGIRLIFESVLPGVLYGFSCQRRSL